MNINQNDVKNLLSVVETKQTVKTSDLDSQFNEMYKTWQADPSKENMQQLVNIVDPIINKAVSTFAGGRNEDLVRAEAKRILIKAIKSYDPQKGKFSTYAWHKLKELQRSMPKMDRVIKIPERVLIDKTRLDEVESTLEEQLGRKPSDAEIADYTGWSIKTINKIRKAETPYSESYLKSMLESDFEPAISIPGASDLARKLEYIYYESTPEEQYIIENIFGLRGRQPSSINQVAKDLNKKPAEVKEEIRIILEKIQQLQI